MFPRFKFQHQPGFPTRHIHNSTWSAASRIPMAYELHNPRYTEKESSFISNNPILILHGFLGSRRENRCLGRIIAQDLARPVFTLDLRNHGDFGHHPKHDYSEMALDVESFIKRHKLENTTLIGHSMGAKTALTLALNSSDLISDVIAIDNCPIHLPLLEDFSNYIEALTKVNDAKVRTHLEADGILKNYGEPSPVRLLLLSNLVKENSSSYLKVRLPLDILKSAIGPLGDFPHRDKTVKFCKPALFLRALQSHYIPEDAFPLISSFFPLSRIIDIDCGHWIVQEQPEKAWSVSCGIKVNRCGPCYIRHISLGKAAKYDDINHCAVSLTKET